jgi:phosphoribosylformimino-5-aminoimidazole carboxamide ribotide isomerase
MKGERVLPNGEHPREILAKARDWNFEGAIILNIGAVGTGSGINIPLLSGLKEVLGKPLLYGGGVATPGDLDTLDSLGFDGAIVATAVHRGSIPLSDLRRGRWS